MRRVGIVGAGITGLAAAWELSRSGVEVAVFDSASTVGGKLQASEVPGLGRLDDGADAFLARVPEAVELCEQIGLDDFVSPAKRNAFVYAAGALHPLPTGQLLGLPTDLDELRASTLLSPAGIERAAEDLASTAPPLEGDCTIGELVRARLGDEVCDHLVQPLVGGINAGEVDALSIAAVAPQHLACARVGGSLIKAAAAMRARAVSDAPVFYAPRAGIAEIPIRLGQRLHAAGVEFRLAQPVLSVTGGGGSWQLNGLDFDGVIVTAPGPAAADLLTNVAPAVAEPLRSLEYASVVMVTVVAPRDQIDHALDGSGLVVARTAGLSATAVSWGSQKWPHWSDTKAVFRISIGHDADPVDWCARSDQDLATTAVADLSTILGESVRPSGVRVRRWPSCLAQYRVGHLGLVESVHASSVRVGRLRVAGASLSGVGIPACIRQGRASAKSLLSDDFSPF